MDSRSVTPLMREIMLFIGKPKGRSMMISPDDTYYRLGPVHTCLYARACRLVTGPLELTRAETGGADRGELKRRGFPGPGFARV